VLIKVSAVNAGETALEFVTALSSDNFAHFREEQVAGSNGGSSVSGTQTRILNTTMTNNITGCSLASNKVTLDAGSYFLDAKAPVYRGAASRAFIYDVTGAAIALLGCNGFTDAASGDVTYDSVKGLFTLSVTSDIELRQYINTAKALDGLGVQSADGEVSVFSDIQIWRLS